MAIRTLSEEERAIDTTAVTVLVQAARALDRVLRGIETLAMVLAALAIVAITVIVCAEVVLRSAFGISTLISAEYAGYLLAATVYLGLAWTFRNGGFIRVELAQSLLRGRVAAVVNLVLAGIALATLVVYSWYIFDFVHSSYRSGATSIFITRTPLWIPQLVLPAGCALMVLTMLSHTIRAAGVLIGLVPPEATDEETGDWL